MMTCTRITSVEYYESMARQIRREAGLSAPDSPLDDTAAAYARKAAAAVAAEGSAAFEAAYTEAFDRALATLRRGHSEGRDQVAYYTDNGAGEANGVWWTRGSGQDRSGDPFRHCPDGVEVDGRVLRDLAAGRDPGSLEPLVRASANGRRSVGYDLQFAAPKSVSVLAAFATPEERARILSAHDRAVRRALDYAHAAGLIVTRTGAQGRERAPAAGVSAAVYRHFTSRAQDPQLHSHAVLLNLCVRADGSTGGLDNRSILRSAGGIAALYRSELASGLRAELGYEAVRAGRNFEVAGVAEPVLELFSKRRAAIERAARERGFDTAEDRVAAQAAAHGTRARKDRETPLAALEAEWERQLVQADWGRAALFEGVRAVADGIRAARVGPAAGRLQNLAEAGLAEALAMQAVVEERALVRQVAEALQCEADADAVLEEVERLRRDGTVVAVGRSAAGEPVYATPEMIEAERGMLRRAYARQDERAFVPDDVLTRVLAERPSLRAEQRAAVRHALNRDGVSVVEGSAGSGKSYAMASVAEAVRACGGEVWVIAPSWKAVDVVRIDTATAEAMARAVTGFLNRIDKGEIALGPRTLVIADEAGMIGTRDLAALVEATAATGAKLVLSGDTRQLAPVAAGAPMRLMVRALGASRMDEIQRQRGRSEAEGAWMRAASVDFAAGRTASALEAYDRGGAITWGVNREATVQALVDAYAGSRLDPEGAQRSRAVLTGWNKDVRELNTRIRDRLKREGLLPEDEDVEIDAIPRGGRAEALALTAGDEVIFGESVKIGDQEIRNADLARVEALSGDPADPVLTLQLAKNGARLSARTSALVGRREPGEPQVPRLQHSYAMTTHAAQGVTVDEAFVADLRGTGAEATYVAMTRHRRTVRLYVDTDRIRERLEAARSGVRPEERGLPVGRGASHPALVPVSHSEIRQAYLSEATGSGGKMNVADFAGPDLRDWCGAPVRSREVPVPPGGRMGLERAGSWRKAISGIASASVSTPSPATRALRQRMEERLHAPAAYPIPQPSRADHAIRFASDAPGQKGRISQLAAILWQGLRREILTAATAIRGLLPLALEQLRADVLIDPRGRMVFARRDQSGRLLGIEQADGTGEAAGNGQQGTTGLVQLGDRRAPKRIYVARTKVEALSLYQQDGQPDRALICGLGGDGPEIGSALAHVVARHPDAAVHLAIDTRADEEEAQAFEAWVLAALRKVQTPEARVTVRRSVPLELFPDGSHVVLVDPVSNEKDRTRRRIGRTRQDRGMEHQVPPVHLVREGRER